VITTVLALTLTLATSSVDITDSSINEAKLTDLNF